MRFKHADWLTQSRLSAIITAFDLLRKLTAPTKLNNLCGKQFFSVDKMSDESKLYFANFVPKKYRNYTGNDGERFFIGTYLNFADKLRKKIKLYLS